MGVEVRVGLPSDLDSIVAVNRVSATHAYASILGDLRYPEEGVRVRYRGLLGEADVTVLMAEEGGRALYVVPERWGTGVAHLLYERAVEVTGSPATL